MKFNEYKYQRPDLEKFKSEMNRELNAIGTDQEPTVEIKAIYNVFKLQDYIDSMAQLVGIRNNLNTKDEFYEKEQSFFDENNPHIQDMNQKFINKLLSSKNREALEKEFGTYIFIKYEIAKKTFHPDIIPDLQQENKLSTVYSKLLAGAEIAFDGKTYNFSQMSPFMQHKDRDIRHRAQLAVSAWLEDHENEIDRIYDEMVKVRDKIAKKLGYKNFVGLAYDRLGRTDYNHLDVKKYRDQIYKEVVPYVSELVKRKGTRLGIKELKSYDLALSFLSGNPTPKGDLAWQVNHAKDMYHEMGPDTTQFFDFMLNHELLELDAKPGKSGGGFELVP